MPITEKIDLIGDIQLNAASSEQLYAQLERQIREKVETRQLLEGQKLPTNQEICRFLNVSYETVQRAMKVLADDGVVVRRQGKGTFVADPPQAGTIGILCTRDVFDPHRSPFFSLMAHHLSEQVHTEQKGIQIYYVPDDLVENSKVYRDLLRDVEQRWLSGLIWINYKLRFADVLTTARRRRLPMVSVTANDCCEHSVWLDMNDFYKRGLERLSERGCRHVMVACFSTDGANISTSAEDIQAAAEGLDIEVEQVSMPLKGYAVEIGEALAERFDASRHDGILVCDDMLAVGLTRRLQRMGTAHGIPLVSTWTRGSVLSLDMPCELFEVNVEKMAVTALDTLEALVKGRRVEASRLLLELEEPINAERYSRVLAV